MSFFLSCHPDELGGGFSQLVPFFFKLVCVCVDQSPYAFRAFREVQAVRIHPQDPGSNPDVEILFFFPQGSIGIVVIYTLPLHPVNKDR